MTRSCKKVQAGKNIAATFVFFFSSALMRGRDCYSQTELIRIGDHARHGWITKNVTFVSDSVKRLDATVFPKQIRKTSLSDQHK